MISKIAQGLQDSLPITDYFRHLWSGKNGCTCTLKLHFITGTIKCDFCEGKQIALLNTRTKYVFVQ